MLLRIISILSIGCLATMLLGAAALADTSFLVNGVTAHRGNSGEHPENTMVAFQSAIDLGADWIELDVVVTKDGQLVVIHDRTTGRVGDRDLVVAESTYEELLTVDVATDFRRRFPDASIAAKPWRTPLLEDVLRLVMQQQKTRVSIQPKVDCVPQAIELIRRLNAQPWVGFNDGNLAFMAQVKQLEPQIPVFWDRPASADVTSDLAIAREHRFEALVLNEAGVTAEKVQQIQQAGLEAGAWTVNDAGTMQSLLEMGIDRIYTDEPRRLFHLIHARQFTAAECEGLYPRHLQGIAADSQSLYWSFTTELVKTDRSGKRLLVIPVVSHHGDLCVVGDRLYVAVNLGKFNDPNGNADNWIYVYDCETLKELSRYPAPEVFHGAGGIAFRNDHFYVVGGLAPGIETNFVYVYDSQFQFVRRIEIASGYTRMGIQTIAWAGDRWLFGCYGDPAVVLVADAEFQFLGKHVFDCSLGVESLASGRLLVASGKCQSGLGCDGRVRLAVVDDETGIRVID